MTQSAAELNPGSLNDFADRIGVAPGSHEALIMHSTALTEYRSALAAEQGVSLEDLHALVPSDHNE